MHDGIRMTRARKRAGSSPVTCARTQNRGAPASAEIVHTKIRIAGAEHGMSSDAGGSCGGKTADQGKGKGSSSTTLPEPEAPQRRQPPRGARCVQSSGRDLVDPHGRMLPTDKRESGDERRGGVCWPGLPSDAGSHVGLEIALEGLDPVPGIEGAVKGLDIIPVSGVGGDSRGKSSSGSPEVNPETGPVIAHKKAGKVKQGRDTPIAEGDGPGVPATHPATGRRSLKRPLSLRSRAPMPGRDGYPASSIELPGWKRSRSSSSHNNDRLPPPAPAAPGTAWSSSTHSAPAGPDRLPLSVTPAAVEASERVKPCAPSREITRSATRERMEGQRKAAVPVSQAVTVSVPAPMATVQPVDEQSIIPTAQSCASQHATLLDDPSCSDIDLSMYDTFMRTQEALPQLRSSLEKAREVQNAVDIAERNPMVAWMCRVQVELGLQPETLHLAVGIMDRTLSTVRLANNSVLRALSVASLHLAIKLEEVEPVALKDLLNCPGPNALGTTIKEVLAMEARVAAALKFRFFFPTPQTFLPRFLEAAGWKEESREALLASYLSEIALTDSGLLGHLPSVMAAAAIRLAQLALAPRNSAQTPEHLLWTPRLEEATGFKYESWALLQVVARLMAVHQLAEHTPVSRGTWAKHTSREKRRVSLITSITSDREPFLGYLTAVHSANPLSCQPPTPKA